MAGPERRTGKGEAGFDAERSLSRASAQHGIIAHSWSVPCEASLQRRGIWFDGLLKKEVAAPCGESAMPVGPRAGPGADPAGACGAPPTARSVRSRGLTSGSLSNSDVVPS